MAKGKGSSFLLIYILNQESATP